jgi:hypothetical protein
MTQLGHRTNPTAVKSRRYVSPNWKKFGVSRATLVVIPVRLPFLMIRASFAPIVFPSGISASAGYPLRLFKRQFAHCSFPLDELPGVAAAPPDHKVFFESIDMLCHG